MIDWLTVLLTSWLPCQYNHHHVDLGQRWKWIVWLKDWLLIKMPQQVDDELEIKAYYAGHVLGAAMFHVKVGQHSFVYTVSAVVFPLVFLW